MLKALYQLKALPSETAIALIHFQTQFQGILFVLPGSSNLYMFVITPESYEKF